MSGVQIGSVEAPDETRTPSKTNVAVVRMGECIKPVVGTDSRHLQHVGLAHSGAMRIAHEDGAEQDIRAGEAYVIEPGHNAWVVGDEPFVGFEFESHSAEEYAKA